MPASDGDRPRGGLRDLSITLGLAGAHGLLFAAAFPGPGLWPLTFVSLVPLVWLAMSAASARRAAVVVFGVQLLMWLWISRWVAAVTAVGYPLLAMYLSAYAVLFFWLVRAVFDHPRMQRWPATGVVPVAWVGLECLRGELLFDGYPWFLVGHPTIQWPLLAQSADALGAYFVSFLAAMSSGLLVDGLRLARGQLAPKVFAGAAAAAVALWTANLSYGAWRLAQTGALSAGPTVLAIQTNLPQDNKIGWPPLQQAADVARFVDQTELAFAEAVRQGRRPDLVVWPETMLPGFGLEPETIQMLLAGGFYPEDAFSSAIEQLADRLGTPLLVGSASFAGLRPSEGRWAWDEHYNSAYLVEGRPPYQRYDKVFLTPFGETMPYISRWPWLERRLLALGAKGMRFDLDASADITRLELSRAGGPVTLATPICFEDTVSGICRKMVYHQGRKETALLVNLSNDGWFGAHDAGRRQHLQAARFRSIENRVPMVRAVNTGLSVAVDSAGRLIGSAVGGRYGSARESGALLVELRLDSRSTVYGRVGNAWGWVCLMGTAALGIGAMIGRRREPGRKGAAIAAVGGCLLVAAGCGMSRTGEPWSTKSQSMPAPPTLTPSMEVAQTGEDPAGLRAGALDVLQQASRSPNPLLRANALEAMHDAPEQLEPLVREGLVDENRGVRFIAAMTIGEFKMEHLSHLLEPLLRDESESVQAAAIYGLKRCGVPVDLTPLASMIVSEDPEVRANAALVLGGLGNPSAIPMIQQAVGRGMQRVAAARAKMVDLQLAEAMVKLGQEQEIQAIRAALFSPAEEGEITALACMMCGRLHDERAVPNLVRLAQLTGRFQQPAEVRMAATWALARIDPPRADLNVPLGFVASEQFQLRVQAALTLGAIGDAEALGTLARLLHDPEPLVQVAAAGAIIQIQPALEPDDATD